MYFSVVRLPVRNAHTHTADPVLEICDYSTDVMKSTAGHCYLGGRSFLVGSRSSICWSQHSPTAPQLPFIPLPCLSALAKLRDRALDRALNALSRNNSVALPCQKASWLFRWKWACYWHGTRPWHPFRSGSRGVLLGFWAERCVGDTGFVLSHMLTFCFMWASNSAAAEVVYPLCSARRWDLCEIWNTGCGSVCLKLL